MAKGFKALGSLRVFGLGRGGVNVDLEAIELTDQELRQAQNVIRGNEGAEGSIVLRPGLKKFTTSPADGQILGSIGVPSAHAGNGRRNTWGWNRPGDDDTWISWFKWPHWGGWGDIGWWEWWDWWGSGEGETGDDGINGDPDTIPPTDEPPRTMFIARDDGYWWREWHKGDAVLEGASPVHDSTGLGRADQAWFPSLGAAGSPTAGAGAPFFAIVNGTVYYSGGYDTTGDSRWPWVVRPNIRKFNGALDELWEQLPTGEIGDTMEDVPAVLSIIAGAGNIYISSIYAGGTTTTKKGRIFRVLRADGVGQNRSRLEQIGPITPSNYWPYSLCWHMGRLWFGTYSADSTFPGQVYFFRPDIDTAFTLDKTFAAQLVDVTTLCSYDGTLYAGLQAHVTTRAIVAARDPNGTWTTVLTSSGGTVKPFNHFRAMVVYKGTLYATYYNPDTTPVATIYAFDGTTWSVAFSGVAADRTNVPFNLTVDGGLLYAYGGRQNTNDVLTSAHKVVVLVSSDGVTWVDRGGAPFVDNPFTTATGPLPILFGLGPTGIGD